jgi:hypothetical protein
MYDPVGIPRRLTRRGVKVALVFLAVLLVAIVVTVVRTMPHPQQEDPLTLEQMQLMLIPDAAQTELVAAQVKARLAQANATPGAAAAAASCVASNPPNTWDGAQRTNATTIYQVGVALSVPTRGEIVAVATAIQESQLYNLGDLGARNDHDSLGLFQQRPSMGWGSPSQVMDPVYSATAFYLALKRVPGWESMAVTVAAQRVQRSAFPNAYAKWEKDATSLVQKAICSAPLAG